MSNLYAVVKAPPSTWEHLMNRLLMQLTLKRLRAHIPPSPRMAALQSKALTKTTIPT